MKTKTSEVLYVSSAVVLVISYLAIVFNPFNNIDWTFVGVCEVAMVGMFLLGVVKDNKGE